MQSAMSNKKASAASPSRYTSQPFVDFVLHKRLQRCWEEDINWDKVADKIKDVRSMFVRAYNVTVLQIQGLKEIGSCYGVPPVAALGGLILVVSFSMLHSIVKVEESELIEPVLVWISICMPPGATNSPLCNYLRELVNKARNKSVQGADKLWMLGDQSFEKLGELMSNNQWKVLGHYLHFCRRLMFVEGILLPNHSKYRHFLHSMVVVSG